MSCQAWRNGSKRSYLVEYVVAYSLCYRTCNAQASSSCRCLLTHAHTVTLLPAVSFLLFSIRKQVGGKVSQRPAAANRESCTCLKAGQTIGSAISAPSNFQPSFSAALPVIQKTHSNLQLPLICATRTPATCLEWIYICLFPRERSKGGGGKKLPGRDQQSRAKMALRCMHST